MKEKTRLEKFKVCIDCHAVGMIHGDCVCSYGKYETIELEFEVCKCCNNITQDGYPADTKFNRIQLGKHSNHSIN